MRSHRDPLAPAPLSREIAYLEASLREVDLSLLAQAMSGALHGRHLRLSDFVHSSAARGWRVRLKALREHPDYELLLAQLPAEPPVELAPLSALVKLKSGVTQRRRPKAQLSLPWYKITQFRAEGMMMEVKGPAEDQLMITARELHGALKPHDLLILSKGGRFGVYMRPQTAPLKGAPELGELAHTSFITLSAERLDHRIIHPAYLAAYLTSAEGLQRLKALQEAKHERSESPLEWSLSIKDLDALEVPLCSPFRQALMISTWAHRVELRRQRRVYHEALSAHEAARCADLIDSSLGAPELETTSAHEQHLRDLVQPLDGEGPLRPLPLHEAPLFPTVGRHMILRALTRHLMELPSEALQQGWRALNIATIGHPSLLRALSSSEPSWGQRSEELQEAINQQCVGLCSVALNSLNKHLLVSDSALGLPRHSPEPWFYFASPSPQLAPDLAMILWGHAPDEAPSLGRAMSECEPLARSAMGGSEPGEQSAQRLCSVVRVPVSRLFAHPQLYAHTLGGELDFEGWQLYLLIYRAEPRSSVPDQVKSDALHLSSLDRLYDRAPLPLVPQSAKRLWQQSLCDLIDSATPRLRYHAEHITTLQAQLEALTGEPQ